MDVRTFDRALVLIQRYSVMVDEVLVNAALEACASLRDAGRLTTALNISKRSGWTIPMQGGLHTYIHLKAYGQSRLVNIAWRSGTTSRAGRALYL